jgi:hypothetical protein
MIKLLLYKVLPAGAAAALLFSNASPLESTLHAFESAGNALGGDEAVNTSDLAFPDEASVNSAIGGGWADRGGGGGGKSGGFSLGKAFSKLFGSSNSTRTQAQLASIIASVKAKAPSGGAPVNPKAACKGTGKAAPAHPKAPGKAAPTPAPKAEPTPAGAPP